MQILATFHPRKNYGVSIRYTVENGYGSIKSIQDAKGNDVRKDWTQADINAVYDAITNDGGKLPFE